MRILHTADLHLGRTGKDRDIWHQWEKIIEIALKENIHILLIAGDVFDNGQAEAVLKKKFVISLNKLANQGIQIFIIPGNHDLRQGNALTDLELPGVNVFYKYTVVNLDKIALHFFPFKPELSGQDLVGLKQDSGAECQIGVCHASYITLPEVFSDLGDSQAIHCPLSPEDIRDLNLDYLALGHYHNPKQWQVGKTQCVYPGSIEPLSFKEIGPRQVFIIQYDHGLRVYPIEIGYQRPYLCQDIQIPKEDIHALWPKIEELAQDFGPCFLRLTIKGVADKLLFQAFQLKAEAFLKERAIEVSWQDETVDLGWIEENRLAKQFKEAVQHRVRQSPEKEFWWQVFYRGISLLKHCENVDKKNKV